MKFAVINGNKVEARKGFTGICANCGAELIAKCGEDKILHWPHKSIRNCDPWWKTRLNGIAYGKDISSATSGRIERFSAESNRQTLPL